MKTLLLVVLCALAGCVSARFRDGVVVPAVAADAPAVREYARWGVEALPEAERAHAWARVTVFFSAAEAQDRSVLVAEGCPLRAEVMELCRAGVRAREAAGVLARPNAQVLLNDVREYDRLCQSACGGG